MISNEQLTEWERLANEATPGPWYMPEDDDRAICYYDGDCGCYEVALANERGADSDFIIAAREAVPALIARVRELEKEAAWLAVQCERLDFAGRDARAWRRFAQEVAENG